MVEIKEVLQEITFSVASNNNHNSINQTPLEELVDLAEHHPLVEASKAITLFMALQTFQTLKAHKLLNY